MSSVKVTFLIVSLCIIASAFCQQLLRRGDWFAQRTSFSQSLDCYRLDLEPVYSGSLSTFQFAETFFLRGLRNSNRGYLVRNSTSSAYDVFLIDGERTPNEINVRYSDPYLQVTEIIINGTSSGSIFCLIAHRKPTTREQIVLNRICNTSSFFEQSQDGC